MMAQYNTGPGRKSIVICYKGFYFCLWLKDKPVS
jgi:hypothetical protein